MSNSIKKNRRQLSKSRLATASQVAVEAMESRLLMTGSVVYSYVTDHSSYTIGAGQTATVKVYLQETLNGNSSIIDDAANENGLLSAGFEVTMQTQPTNNPSLITALTPDATDFSGDQVATVNNPNLLTPNVNEADLGELISASATVGVTTGNSGAPSNDVYLGSLTITGGSTPGTTTFQLGAYDVNNSYGGNTITQGTAANNFNNTDVDLDGTSNGGISYLGASDVQTAFTVTTTLPTPSVTAAAPNMTYTGSAYSSATTAVTGGGGADGGATATYNYYVGTGTGGTNLGAAAPINAGTYTVVASFAGDSTYAAANSTPVTFQITPATVTASVSGASKTYDGTTADAGAAFGLSGVISPDVVSASGTAVFASKDAGTGITINATGITLSGAQASNYVLAATTATGSANITAMAITPTLTAANKTYDQTTSDTGATFGLTGVITGDTVTATGTATFASDSVGTGIAVNATGITLNGAQAGDYSLSSTTATGSANITAKSITPTVTGANKVYDGTISDTGATFGLTGLITGDIVTDSGTAAFASASVGTGIAVNGTGITLAGPEASDYTLAGTSATGSANITAKTVTATVTGASKVYDGTTSDAAATFGLTGLVMGDTVTAGGTATFAGATVGTGIAVNATGITLSGAKAANYSLAGTTASSTANITKATPTVTVTTSGSTFSAAIAGVSGPAASTLETVGLTLNFYAGALTPAQIAGATSLGSAVPTASGTYTVVATFAGSTDYAAVTTAGVSNTGSFSIVSGSPTFPASYAFTPGETPFTNSVVGSVKATPAFTGQLITYSLTGGNASSFLINSGSGAITSKNPLDLAVKSNFSFTVVASGKSVGGVAVSATVPVTVTVQEVLPTITDTKPSTTVKDNATVYPLSSVTIADIIPTHVETVTVTMDPTRGSLKDPSFVTQAFGEIGTSGLYTFTGTPAQANYAIRDLVYTPAKHQIAPNSSYTTPFAISVSTPLIAGSTVTKSAATTVTVTAVNTNPTLAGLALTRSTSDKAAIAPFGSATITDPDDGSTTFGAAAFVGQSETVTVTESNKALGTLSGGGFTGSNGVYTFTGTPAQATAALQALTFTPTANVILSGYPATETLTVGVVDAAGGRSSTTGNKTAIEITPVGRLTALTAVLTNPNLLATSTGPTTHPVVARGVLVVTLTGNDPDAGDLLTYSLVSGTGGGNNADFYVSGNKLAVNLTAGLVAGTYDVLVKVTDKGGDSVTQALAITIGYGSTASSVSLV